MGNLVSTNVILDINTGRSRGCGFVDYTSYQSRENAIERLHNSLIHEQKIRVSRSEGKCTLYVGNLPPMSMPIPITLDESSTIQEKLEQLSSIPIKRIRKRKGYNYGFVEYDNHRQAQAALISLRNAKWNEYELRVEIACTDLQDNTEINGVNHNNKENIPTTSTINIDTDIADRDISPQSSASLKYIPNPFISNDDDNDNDQPQPTQFKRDQNEKRRTLYIKNLDKSTNDEEFKCMFEAYGKLTRCLIIRDVPLRKLNYGFIQYESISAAHEAYQKVHGRLLNGIPLHIEFSKSLPGERKKRLINTRNKYSSMICLSPNDERVQDLHILSQQKKYPNSRRNSSMRSRSRTRSMRSRSRSPSQSRARSSSSASSASSSSSSSCSASTSPSRARSRSQSRARSPSNHRQRSRSKSISVSRSRHGRKKRDKHHGSRSSSSTSSSSSASSLSSSSLHGDGRRGNNRISNNHNRMKSSHNHRNDDDKKYDKKKYSSLAMCVNLPNEYDLKRMSHLIGYDPNKQGYILFSVNQTSSSLSKLQNVLDKKNVHLRNYGDHKHNGHSHSKTRDRDRHRDRDRNRDRDRERRRNRDRNKRRERRDKYRSRSRSRSRSKRTRRRRRRRREDETRNRRGRGDKRRSDKERTDRDRYRSRTRSQESKHRSDINTNSENVGVDLDDNDENDKIIEKDKVEINKVSEVSEEGPNEEIVNF